MINRNELNSKALALHHIFLIKFELVINIALTSHFKTITTWNRTRLIELYYVQYFLIIFIMGTQNLSYPVS